MRISLVFPALLVAIFGCSGSPSSGAGDPGPNAASVTGSIGGTAFQPSSAIAAYGTLSTGPAGTVKGLRINVSTRANTCANAGDANSSELDLSLPSDPASPGTFTLSAGASSGTSPHAAFGIYGEGTVMLFEIESGTLTITSATGAAVIGSFDLTFGPGDSSNGAASQPGGRITGTFDALLCP
jgi:hypothetical protein